MRYIPQHIKHRSFIGLFVGAVYCMLWLVTSLAGCAEVRDRVLKAMALPAPAHEFVDVTSAIAPPRLVGKVYYCRAVAYAPFVVQVDYGWGAGPLSGEGGRTLYLWVVVTSVRLYDLAHWSA